MLRESWIGKYFEVSGRGLILRYPGIRLEELTKTTKNLSGLVGSGRGQILRYPGIRLEELTKTTNNLSGLEGSGRGPVLRYPGISLEGLTKTTNNLCQDSRSSSQDLNPGPPEYEAGVLTTRPRSSVSVHRKLNKNKWFEILCTHKLQRG
jgi:hypothetical protein